MDETSKLGKAMVTNQLIVFLQSPDPKNPNLKANQVEVVTREVAAEVGTELQIAIGKTIDLVMMGREKGTSLNVWVEELVIRFLWVVWIIT